MNGIRPRELLELLRVVEERPAEAGGEPLVLATAISLDGTVYTRAGAMGVFVPGGHADGAIPVRSLQGGFHAAIDETAADGRPRLARLRITEDDPILGYGFLCAGDLEVFLEPVDEDLRSFLRKAGDALLAAEGVVASLEIEGPQAGARTILPADHPAARDCYREGTPEIIEEASQAGLRRTFLCPIRPSGKVLILGSGPDAAFLTERLADLGFVVYAADPRPGRLRNVNWNATRALVVDGGWETACAAVRPDEDVSIVVMTHSLEDDRAALRAALASPAGYVGLAGSAQRTRELVAELGESGVHPRPETLYAPAGLDIGAETPEETALGIAAEILAVRSGRRGGRQSARARPHGEAHGHAPPAAVPGLILAAGRGRRFGAGHKLSALFQGQPVLRHVVLNALASRLDPVIVVLGCDADAGLKAIAGLDDPRLRVVFNPSWASGRASSIQTGLREAPAGAPGVLVLLGDMPMVKPWLIDRVLAEFELSGRLVFPVYAGPEGPQRGHPTAFPRSMLGEIKALSADDTTADTVRRHWSQAMRVTLDDGETQLDIDKPEDLELLPKT